MTHADSTGRAAIFPARRNGRTTTAIARRASLIWIGHNPGGHPVMPCIPLALTGPAGPSVPEAPGTGRGSGAGPGWAYPGQDHSGLWLRNAAAGLCVLAAAAAAVSFTAFGGLRYRSCLNAFQAGADRGLAVSRLVGCGG
jgi:hypothetical protein